jgi:hypothetical protein
MDLLADPLCKSDQQNDSGRVQGCQMVQFHAKDHNTGIFGGPWNEKMLVYFMAISFI